jgi:hypothetical protein
MTSKSGAPSPAQKLPEFTLAEQIADFWQRHSWLALGLLWALALYLAYVGFLRYAALTGQPYTPFDLVYLTIQLIGMNSGNVEPPVPWQLEVARFLLPLLTAWTAARALALIFHDRWQQFLMRTTWRNHVVICGLSQEGWLLAQGFAAEGRHVVVITLDESSGLVSACRAHGVVLIGDAADPEVLRRAGVLRAAHLISVIGDIRNVEVAQQAALLLRTPSGRRRRHPLLCTIHLQDPVLVELAQTLEMMGEQDVPLRLELFNIYDRGARQLWNSFAVSYPYGTAASPAAAASAAHIMVIGLGRLGEGLVVQAAREWYGRMRHWPAGKLRATVIDLEAEAKCQALSRRYPKLAEACDLAPLAMDVRGADFQEATLFQAGVGYPAPAVIFICFSDGFLGLRTALDISHRLQQLPEQATRLVTRVAEERRAQLLGADADGYVKAFNLHVFGLLDNTCTPQVIQGDTLTQLARGLHINYVRRQRQAGKSAATNSLLVPWSKLSEELRQWELAEADAIGQHLATLGYRLAPLTDWDAATFQFSPAEQEQLARLEQERFLATRQQAGWRYDPGGEDVQAKTSARLLPWEELPDAQRAPLLADAADLPMVLVKAGFQMMATVQPRAAAAQPPVRSGVSVEPT